VQGASRAYWASWADAAGSAPQLLERSPLPIPALGGEHDWNVPPEHVHAWDEHLPPDSRIEVLPQLTHILTRLTFDDDDRRAPTELGTGSTRPRSTRSSSG
jgi:pimeloyl-ACP methyl ester carboxylesterase